MKLSTDVRFGLAQRGMTLVEVMVGLAIGLIGMLVIFQTVSVWDARTRATTAGSDSQVTGTIAMYNLERDLRLAGQGFGTADSTVMGCQVSGFDGTASAAVGFPLTPIVIVDNDATNQPDQIATLYGNSPYFTTDQRYGAGTAHSIGTYDRTGFRSGDLAVVANSGGAAPGSADCQLVEITDDSTTGDPKTLRFDLVSYNHFYQNGANLPSRFNTAAGIGASFPSGKVFSLGPLPRRNVWSVASGVLGRQDELQASAFFAVAEGVVDMKAEYGYDVDDNNVIAAGEWMKTLPVPTDWSHIRAIRVALLVRSRNYEKPGIVNSTEQNWNATNPVWHPGGGAAVNFVMRNVDGTADSFAPGDADPNNWRNYRYTVYEKVFPLRNVIWGQ
ncbi:MAG: PilW family protein [Caldimonas sp.]